MPTVPDNIVGEQWRPVVGYEGWYDVSNYGRVRRSGPGNGTHPGRILSTPPRYRKDKPAYPKVGLWRDGEVQDANVHQLVAYAFLGPCPSGHVVNHMDTNKHNPRLDNLEYVTPKGNREHAMLNNCYPKGPDNPNAKLSEADVRLIKKMKGVIGHRKLARFFGVSAATVHFIHTGRNWGHLV